MNRKAIIAVTLIGLGGLGLAGVAIADSDDFDCRRGAMKYERGERGHYGRHMMGGPMMGFLGKQSGDKNLSAESARDILEGMLAWHGNTLLKVGKVDAKDDKTITAEVTTQDGSLVQILNVDRATGRAFPKR